VKYSLLSVSASLLSISPYDSFYDRHKPWCVLKSLKKKVKQSHYRTEQTQTVGRVIALLFLDLGARKRCVVSITPRPLYSRGRPGTHCTGGWLGPRAGLDVCEKSRPTGIRSTDRPARSHSLYRLRYPGPHNHFIPFWFHVSWVKKLVDIINAL
jgi:hypothetical protein